MDSHDFTTDTPPALPCYWGNLPTELLKKVVVEVHKQDEANKDAKHGYSVADDEDLSKGGLRLRQLTLPFLLRTVTPEQLLHPTFLFLILPDPTLCGLIRQLDILPIQEDDASDPYEGFVRINEDLEKTAHFLPHLPNLNTLSCVALQRLYDFQHDEVTLPVELWETSAELERAEQTSRLARAATRRVFTRVRELRVDVQDYGNAVGLLNNPSRFPSLRRHALRSLSIQNTSKWRTPLGVHKSWQVLRLPSLTSLAIDSHLLGDQVLPTVSGIAPNLESRTLTSIRNKATFLHTAPFLRLRHLHLTGSTSGTEIFPVLSSSPLEWVTLDLSSPALGPTLHFVPHLDRLPSSLRRLDIARPSALKRDSSTLRAILLERGAGLATIWTPCFEAFQRGDGGKEAPKNLRSVFQKDLRWARERIDWLEKLGDTHGMQEMAEAMSRVRERRALEEQ
ncbi:hypothetical protein JCM8547_005221 [Rhodosporidiobolus lusitaniae]